MVLIALVFFGWYISVPMKKGFEERFSEKMNYTDPRATQASNRLNITVDNAQTLVLYLFVGVFLLWAFGNMQSRERYSGRYG